MIRIRTTGGGGWGNPLERDPALVVRDVVWRKVSPEAALADYGVVLTGSLDDDSLAYDDAATAAERASRPAPSEVFFDRGPGYARLSGGADHAEVDVLMRSTPRRWRSTSRSSRTTGRPRCRRCATWSTRICRTATRRRCDWGIVTWVVPLRDYPDTYNGKALPYISLASRRSTWRST